MLGQVTPASVVKAEDAEMFVGRVLSTRRDQHRIASQEELSETELKEAIGLDLSRQEKETFQSFLTQHHHAFCLKDGERGQMDLIRMEIM